MRFARVPYRWLPRTAWRNVRSILEDLFWYGPRNVLRWAPVIWLDADFDWSDLAVVMEYKLRRMSKVIGNGHHVGRERDARQMLICAVILKRLREDDYSSLSGGMADDEQRLLGKLIGRHLRGWWD